MSKKLYSYKIVFPALILYSMIFVLPVIMGMYFALTDWRADGVAIHFIGLENFIKIFQDATLLHAILNTFIYTGIVVFFKNFLGLLLALAVNVKLKLGMNHIFRAVFYLPAVISTIVIGIVFTRVLHPEGILNQVLHMVGLAALERSWLTDTKIVMAVISFVSVWQWAGYHMCIYLAGLQGISIDYYEAATIDGAGAFQKLRYITLPMLAPSININVIFSIIGGLKGFSEVYALTNGGPGNASQVITTQVLAKFGQGSWGLGTALNTLLLLIVALICIPLLRQMRKQEVEM